jgi:hypothetical protein
VEAVEAELTRVMERLTREHDVVPFLDRRFSPAETSFKPLPAEMGLLLSSSSDYTSPEAGEGPVWLQVEGPERGVELVVYRQHADGILYVLAPSTSSLAEDKAQYAWGCVYWTLISSAS